VWSRGRRRTRPRLAAGEQWIPLQARLGTVCDVYRRVDLNSILATDTCNAGSPSPSFDWGSACLARLFVRTKEEDARLREAVGFCGEARWKDISGWVGTRTHVQCLQRWKKVRPHPAHERRQADRHQCQYIGPSSRAQSLDASPYRRPPLSFAQFLYPPPSQPGNSLIRVPPSSYVPRACRWSFASKNRARARPPSALA
jgi:hypothetical protein